MPRVHSAAALLRRWLMGAHQGGVSLEHLDAYLNEFTFRFNRRRLRSRGKLYYRLLEQAVTIEPVPYKLVNSPSLGRSSEPESILLTDPLSPLTPSG